MDNIKQVLLVENKYVRSLYPFSILHSGWELRCGAFRIFEKLKQIFKGSNIIYYGRNLHLESFLARFNHNDNSPKKANTLILFTSILPLRSYFDELTLKYNEYCKEAGKQNVSVVFVHKGQPLSAYLSEDDIINPIEFDLQFLPKLLTDYSHLIKNIEISEPKILNFLWDAIEFNSESIIDDSAFFKHNPEYFELENKGVHFVNKESIFIGEGCKISPGAVLDAGEGPIIIGNAVRILPNSVILGPCFIGDNCIIKAGAKIYEHNSFGEYCKVGGEVENSIIQSYSNKQHEGFLGHSFLCEWVNLGADTNTSDLKNTYGNIKVMIEDEEFDTGRMFLGLLCGDHTKSAINTSFTTGTIAGIAGILVANGFLPRFIPSFSWGGENKSSIYKINKAIEVAKIVMARRGKTLLPEEEKLMTLEYESTHNKYFKK